MKVWARELAVGLLLATAVPPAIAFAAPSAEQILLDKVNYWRLKDRPDLAMEALQKLLAINPNNQDALYQQGLLSVQQNKPEQARQALAHLRQVNPSNPHISDLENSIRAGQVSPNELGEARRLAQAGQFSQAAAKYEQTFKGPPPPTFGIEYYMTLAGTDKGWPEARRGLERLAQANPNDNGAKLALAEILTYHADTRPQGIRMLAQLSNDPVVGSQAAQAWKKAIQWLGNSAQDRALYNQYLAKFGQDADVRQHMTEVQRPGGAVPGGPRPAASESMGAAPSPATRAAPSRRGQPAASYYREARAPQSERLSTVQSSQPAPGSNRARSDALRNEAKALQQRGDIVAAQARYQEAIAVDPASPWARLDLARFLVARGDPAQAFTIVDPAATGNTPDSFQAAALFYSEQNRFQDALAALDRVPAGSRNADLTALRERTLVTVEIGRAKQMARSGYRAEARNMLIGLNARPPATAEKSRLIADALADIGDIQTALQIARPPASATDKKAALDYAALLQRAGRDAEAAAYLHQAEATGRITGSTRNELEHIKADIAIKRADQLRTRGDVAGAYDQISPLLNAYPNDPNLLMAAGRVYAAGGQNTLAMRFFDAAYQKAPTDLNIIQGVVGGSIMAGDLDRARAYLAQGYQIAPNNPRLYFLQSEIARATGDNGAAIYDLAIARSLNMQQASGAEPLPMQAPGAPLVGGGRSLPPNPFRQSEAETPAPTMKFAQAAALVATDATPFPRNAPAPLQETAISADSDDLVVPPRPNERPPRPSPTMAESRASMVQLAAAPGMMAAPVVADAALQPWTAPPAQQISQLPPLPPPPLRGYQPPGGYMQQSIQQPLQPYGMAPIGAAPASVGVPAPLPQDSLELDIERSLNAIASESAPTVQAGFSLRERTGEEGLSRLSEFTVPIEGTFSPFFTGTARLQAIPTYLTAGTATFGSLLRFGNEPLLALPGSGATTLLSAGSQTAGGVSLNAAYSYQMFSGEIGTTPLGFPVENLVGRIALTWPGPGTNSSAIPTIPLAPTTVANPLTVKVEGARQPITDSVLSFAGTRDPITGQVWGGVIKTGGDALVSYDDGLVGVYGGGGFWSIDGKSVASNSEREALVGAYVRPYRSGANAFKIGVNVSYMGYDKNLRFFTFGQGGYFSPQTYLNFSVPMEYSGRNGRFTYLVGGALGVQTFDESRTPVFPRNPTNQSALQTAFGNAAFYPSRSVTDFAFGARGQVEYQLDNGFTIGGLASVDNAQNYTEGIAKIYLRKSFGASLPASVYLPNSLPGRL